VKSGGRTRDWYQRHTRDPYVRGARERGWRSRAVYKLEQIDARDHLFKAGITVLDLGAAPGSWSQYAARQVGAKGRVIATDVLWMPPLANVDFVQGDFREESLQRELLTKLSPSRADLVLSDMAPNITGVAAADQVQVMVLAQSSLALAQEILKRGGDFVVKLFQGEGFDQYVLAVRALFTKAVIRKPAASRSHSREMYLVAKNYRL
jgi:23S rRNA (uridine2552-2'-O)-methyltransferase